MKHKSKDHHMMAEDHEGHGHHLAAEHRRHGERIHHEMFMHKKGHHGMYKHEEDHPSMPAQGHMLSGMGAEDFKAEADPIAYGQAGKAGMESDMKKIHAQFKQYHWG